MVRLTQRGNAGRLQRRQHHAHGCELFRPVRRRRPRNADDAGQDYETGANPRLALPANPIGRRDTIPAVPCSTLRVSLTLYEANGGKVLWSATASCSVRASAAMQAGLSIVNHIFDGADANRVGDAGCPL